MTPHPARRKFRTVVFVASLVVALFSAGLFADEYLSGKVWPKPPVVEPGDNGGPPSDAILLFDGHDLAQWEGSESWLIEDGIATARGGGITSKQAFGDCQLHVEWASPEEVSGEG